MPATDALVARIREEFPKCEFKDVRRIEGGGKHIVLILDSRWVFRFERVESPDTAERFKQELKLLDALRKKVTVTIPEYTYVSKSGFFGGHQLLLGTPLTAQRFALIPDNRTEQILRHVAQFLRELHALPISMFTLSDPESDHSWPLSRYQERFEKERKEQIKGYISSPLGKALSQFFEEHAQETFPTSSIIHADFRDAHILLERGGMVPGIIDFGDCRIGDPAEDMAFFWTYGEDAVDQLVAEYNGDPSLKHRTWVHFIRYMTDQLFFGVRSNNPMYVSFVAALLEHHLKK